MAILGGRDGGIGLGRAATNKSRVERGGVKQKEEAQRWIGGTTAVYAAFPSYMLTTAAYSAPSTHSAALRLIAVDQGQTT